MLDHDTLGGTGGSRRVHDTGKVVCLGRDRLGRVVVAETQQLVEADNLQVGMRARKGIDVLLLSIVLGAVDDNSDILGRLEGVHEPGQQFGVGEHDLCVCLLHAMRETLFAECVVCGYNSKRLREGAVGGGQPLHARGSEQVQAVVRLVAEMGEGRSHSKDHLLELDEALVAVGAELEVLPLLVHLLLLAIDHLLDLLCLFVDVDNLARTHALCVAKLSGRVAEHIVQCVDALLRCHYETVLGDEVATRYRLALRLLNTGHLACVRPTARRLSLGREFLEVLRRHDGGYGLCGGWGKVLGALVQMQSGGVSQQARRGKKVSAVLDNGGQKRVANGEQRM